MVRRLTTDQEIAGSSPASVILFCFFFLLPLSHFLCVCSCCSLLGTVSCSVIYSFARLNEVGCWFNCNAVGMMASLFSVFTIFVVLTTEVFHRFLYVQHRSSSCFVENIFD